MTKFVRSCNKMFFISINKKFPCAELSLGHRQHRIIVQIQMLKWSKTSTGTLPLPSLPFSTVSISTDIRTGRDKEITWLVPIFWAGWYLLVEWSTVLVVRISWGLELQNYRGTLVYRSGRWSGTRDMPEYKNNILVILK